MLTILKFFSGAFSFFGTLMGYLEKRKFENEVKNKYEEKKKTDALEEDKKTKEIIDDAQKKSDAAQESVREVNKVDMRDSEITDEQKQKQLDEITDLKEKMHRENQINLAREIKTEADKKKQEIETNEKFNSGDEITFKG